MKLFFVTQSENKIAEATSFFAEISDAGGRSIDFCILKSEIQEIMHPKLDEVVRWKALEAFRSHHPRSWQPVEQAAPCLLE